MALPRFGRHGKRPVGFCVKTTAVAFLGLCFIVFWSMFSSPASSVTSQRSTFGEISEPVLGNQKGNNVPIRPKKREPGGSKVTKVDKRVESDLGVSGSKEEDGSIPINNHNHNDLKKDKKKAIDQEKNGIREPVVTNATHGQEELEVEDEEEEVGEGKQGMEDQGEEANGEVEDGESNALRDQESIEVTGDENGGSKSKGNKNKKRGPVFDPKAHYSWKTCSVRSKHNYIPCIDVEGTTRKKLQSYRHRERSCPRAPPMCLVPLPSEGYGSPVHWPESKWKILYRNVAHPKLAAFIKTRSWLRQSGEFLTFPQDQSEFKGGVPHYIESIDEMVPDIEWGKNIRVVLDIGCRDASFGAALLGKEVLTLSLGLKDDLTDLAQVALERGFPAVVNPFATRRLPFPSSVFDTIHCGGCGISWHSNGVKLLLEMNRMLRPGGYFILSTKHENIEEEEAMSTLTSSICWNILAHKTDEISEVGVKIFQKPESNDIYELRRKKFPPMCKEDENPDAAWYVHMKTCLHTIPAAIEQRGAEWPEEWPKRLEAFPDWFTDRAKLFADTEHWRAIVNNSYLNGLGIDWSTVRNIMDMKSIYGGFAAALSSQKVWVMNVVPVHAPDTLPVIYERGLLGIYHDWCESFGTYPRSYDLLHADHLFSRLKNSCKHPVGIVVEMDRILRPGGWAIIRDKVEILDPLEQILRSLHWEIRMTYAQDREGILCVQKTMWRP